MERIVNGLTNYCLRTGIIERDQFEWCQYIFCARITNIWGFLLLMFFGLFAAPWPQVLLLNLGVAFLRSKTNGLHMPTERSCFLLSLFCEYGCLLAIKHFDSVSSVILALLGAVVILWLAPCNNSAIHYTTEEIQLLRHAVRRRLVIYALIFAVLLVVNSYLAYAWSLAEVAVALFVVAAKCNMGIR